VESCDTVTSRRDIEKNGPLARTGGCEGHVPERSGAVIDCLQLPRVHALADGELTAREAARVRRHLADCAPCRSELAYLMQLAMALARGILAGEAIESPGS